MVSPISKIPGQDTDVEPLRLLLGNIPGWTPSPQDHMLIGYQMLETHPTVLCPWVCSTHEPIC